MIVFLADPRSNTIGITRRSGCWGFRTGRFPHEGDFSVDNHSNDCTRWSVTLPRSSQPLEGQLARGSYVRL